MSIGLVVTTQVSIALARVTASALLGTDDPTVLGLFGGISGDFVRLFGERLKKAGIGRGRRQKFTQHHTIFDFVALAVHEALREASDDDLRTAFGLEPQDIRATLAFAWADGVLLAPVALSTGFKIGQAKPRDGWSEALISELARVFAQAAIDELNDGPTKVIGPDAEVHAFFLQVMVQIPNQVEELYLSIPLVRERLTLIAAESAAMSAEAGAQASRNAVALLNGEQAYADGLPMLSEYAKRVLDWPSRDVFLREHVLDDQPGYMALGTVYVEPLTAHGDTEVLIREAIHRCLSVPTCGVVVVSAPFGMGKSLTSRMLAVDLMRQWLESPADKNFPLYLHAPDIFRGKVVTLEGAVLRHLQNHQGLSVPAASEFWRRASITLVIDSFDEVVQNHQERKTWIEEMQVLSDSPRFSVVLATRPYGVETKWLREQDKTLELQSFGRTQIERWLGATQGILHDGEPTADQLLARLGDELAGTPILLLMATWVWHSKAALDGTKTSLYQGFIDKIALGKWSDVQEAHPVVSGGAAHLERTEGPGAFQRALAMLAWEQGRAIRPTADASEATGLRLRDVEALVRDRFAKRGSRNELTDAEVEQVTTSMVLSMFLRRDAAVDCIRFSHKSFREFLCALHWTTVLNHDPSAAAILLMDFELGTDELQHIAALCERTGQLPKALQVADSAFAETRMVWIQRSDSDSVALETVPGRGVIVRCEEGDERNRRFLSPNGAGLGAMLRGYPPDILQRHMGHHGPVRSVFNDSARLAPYWAQPIGRGMYFPHANFGYETTTGRLLLVALEPMKDNSHRWSIIPRYEAEDGPYRCAFECSGFYFAGMELYALEPSRSEDWDNRHIQSLRLMQELGGEWRDAENLGLTFSIAHGNYPLWILDNDGAWRSPTLEPNVSIRPTGLAQRTDKMFQGHRVWWGVAFHLISRLSVSRQVAPELWEDADWRRVWNEWISLEHSQWLTSSLHRPAADDNGGAIDGWEWALASMAELATIIGRYWVPSEQVVG